MSIKPEPLPVVDAVEQWLSEEHHAVAKYDNRSLLDESGIYGLHELATRIFEFGYEDGVRTERARSHGVRDRAREEK